MLRIKIIDRGSGKTLSIEPRSVGVSRAGGFIRLTASSGSHTVTIDIECPLARSVCVGDH